MKKEIQLSKALTAKEKERIEKDNPEITISNNLQTSKRLEIKFTEPIDFAKWNTDGKDISYELYKAKAIRTSINFPPEDICVWFKLINLPSCNSMNVEVSGSFKSISYFNFNKMISNIHKDTKSKIKESKLGCLDAKLIVAKYKHEKVKSDNDVSMVFQWEN